MNVRTMKIKMGKKFLTSLTILSLAFSGQVAFSTIASAASPSTLITFETAGSDTASITTNDFGGAVSSVVDAPVGGSSVSVKAAKVAIHSGDAPWAGALLYTAGSGDQITTSDNKTVTMNVYVPRAGMVMHAKLQVGSTEALNTEVNSTETTVAGWQKLTFDFANAATSTPPWSPWDVAKLYTRLYVFPAFSTGADTKTTNEDYFFDDIAFNGATTPAVTIPGTPGGGSGGGDTSPATLITFESDDATGWSWIENWDGTSSSVSSEPPAGGSSGSTKSGKIVKSGAFWSGTTFLSTNVAGKTLIDTDHKVVTMNVYAPDAGKKVLLQLKSVGANRVVEKFATQLTVVGWQTLTFDFSLSSDNGSPAFDAGIAYDKASVMFSFGEGFTDGGIWYFDDVAFNGATTPALVPVEVPPVEVPPVVVIDEAAVQAALKVATAKAVLGTLLEGNKPATLDQYRDASYFMASQSALVRVNAAVAKMSASDRAEMSKVMEIIKAENFIDRIANPESRPGLTSAVLINAGLLSLSSPYKYSVLAGLQVYKESSLDSLAKIAVAIKAEIAKANSRKERTLEIRAKIAARQKRQHIKKRAKPLWFSPLFAFSQ